MAEEKTAPAPAPATQRPATPRQLTLLLADDHEVVRLALRVALAPLGEDIEWIEAADAAATEAALSAHPDLDLALIDLTMPGTHGTQTIADLHRRYPTIPLVVMSATEDAALVARLIDDGVAGFIPKSDPAAVMLQAVRLVLAGGTYAPLRLRTGARPAPAESAAGTERSTGAPQMAGLTARQADVLRLLARGLPNKLIARELGLSEGTVKVHLLAIFRVLRARNRTEAVLAAQKQLGGSS
jgi:DNA-binding NarL/FixJ family response regulator